MKIQFIKYGKNQGVLCDRCGTYIENVWQIESSGLIHNIGCECFKKIETNLTDYGIEQLKKYMNDLINKQKQIELIETGKIDKLNKGNQTAIKNYGINVWLETLKARYIDDIKEVNKKCKNIKINNQ